MSADASDGVVSRWGQAHDVKSPFVGDGSVLAAGRAENPTLSIVTRAMPVAHRRKEAMTRRSMPASRVAARRPPRARPYRTTGRKPAPP